MPDPSASSNTPRIQATNNGPYEVSGIRRIVWQDPVETDQGEPIAWQERDVVANEEKTYWLCRCGNSSNKPFCDGSHRTSGFTAEDQADETPRSARTKAYVGQDVEVLDDRSLCVHAGFCSTKATNVWKMTKRADQTDTRSLLIAMTQRCPSGALTVRTSSDQPDLEPSLPAAIGLIPDGPLWVTGGVEVTRSDGVRLEVRNRVTLCRCGASKTKPLCDGSHSEVGFEHRP